jgi:hypothetical protein
MTCANCGQPLPVDHEAEETVNYRYCHLLLCSEDCADDHEQNSHPDDAGQATDESEERR